MVGQGDGDSGLEFLVCAFDDMLGVEVNEVNRCLTEGSGHKYTPCCLEAPWLCPRPDP